MTDFQAIIEQVKAQLDRATDELKFWQSSGVVTITDEKGKVINLRSEMIAKCQHNMQRYRQFVTALEKQAEKPK